jgi:excisionase family DNA binding protein
MRHPTHHRPEVDRIAVSAAEAARMLSLSRSKMYELMCCGELAYSKIGKSRRILVADLAALLDRNRRAE